jgi:hypothetical protein
MTETVTAARVPFGPARLIDLAAPMRTNQVMIHLNHAHSTAARVPKSVTASHFPDVNRSVAIIGVDRNRRTFTSNP